MREGVRGRQGWIWRRQGEEGTEGLELEAMRTQGSLTEVDCGPREE
jgi:hypothetical protein